MISPQTIETVENWCRGRKWYAQAALLLFLIYVAVNHLNDPLYTSIFGGLNLMIHEGGHLLFGYFGRFLMIFGGTILQLAAPIASVFVFLRQPDYFAISVCGVWLATNLYNVAGYIADARAMQLPLVSVGDGGIMHDWNYLLSRMHIISWDVTIGGCVRFLAFICMWGSLLVAIWMIYLMITLPPPPPEEKEAFPPF